MPPKLPQLMDLQLLSGTIFFFTLVINFTLHAILSPTLAYSENNNEVGAELPTFVGKLWGRGVLQQGLESQGPQVLQCSQMAPS